MHFSVATLLKSIFLFREVITGFLSGAMRFSHFHLWVTVNSLGALRPSAGLRRAGALSACRCAVGSGNHSRGSLDGWAVSFSFVFFRSVRFHYPCWSAAGSKSSGGTRILFWQEVQFHFNVRCIKTYKKKLQQKKNSGNNVCNYMLVWSPACIERHVPACPSSRSHSSVSVQLIKM